MQSGQDLHFLVSWWFYRCSLVRTFAFFCQLAKFYRCSLVRSFALLSYGEVPLMTSGQNLRCLVSWRSSVDAVWSGPSLFCQLAKFYRCSLVRTFTFLSVGEVLSMQSSRDICCCCFFFFFFFFFFVFFFVVFVFLLLLLLLLLLFFIFFQFAKFYRCSLVRTFVLFVSW